MKKFNLPISWIIQTILLVVMVVNLTGCGNQLLPKDVATADYPADISGTVMLAQSFTSSQLTYTRDSDDADIFTWIVAINFTNKTYANPEEISLFQFKLIGKNKVYSFSNAATPRPLISVSRGETKEIITCFIVRDNLEPEDTWIEFTSKGTASYGRLTDSEIIPGYDWENQQVLAEKIRFE